MHRFAGSLEIVQGSMPSRRLARQFPVIAGLHKAGDGALVGLLMAVTLMSALTFHYQQRWTNAFTKLETTRTLSHRLMDSTAVLERHLLDHAQVPNLMVPTKVADLVYLDRPKVIPEPKKLSLMGWFFNHSISHGY